MKRIREDAPLVIGPLPECPDCHHRNVHEPTFGGCLEEMPDLPYILGKPRFCCCKWTGKAV